jgi:hypothetical protein
MAHPALDHVIETLPDFPEERNVIWRFVLTCLGLIATSLFCLGVWLAPAAAAGAASASWTCSIRTPQAVQDDYVFGGTWHLGVARSGQNKHARVVNQFIYLVQGNAASAYVQEDTPDRLSMTWTLRNGGRQPELSFERIHYRAVLDLTQNLFSVETQIDADPERTTRFGLCQLFAPQSTG